MSPGSSKTRTQRLASIAVVPTRMHLAVTRLRQRGSIFCILIFATAFVAMIVSLRIWNPHFPYYEGMAINRDIVARVAFETIDTAETEKEKMLMDSRTPYIYVRNNDPDILKENINSIYRIVKEAAQAESFDQLSPELQQQFMVPDDSQDSGATPGTRNIWKFLRKNPAPEEKVAVTTSGAQDENKIIVAEPKTVPITEVKPSVEVESATRTPSIEESSEAPKTEENSEPKAPLKGLEKVLAPTAPENPAVPTDNVDEEGAENTEKAPKMEPETAAEGGAIPFSEGLLTEVEHVGDRLGAQVATENTESKTEKTAEPKSNAEGNLEEKNSENGDAVSVSVEKSLSDFCDVLEETMKPFCAQGLMHIAEVKEDPLGRGLQIQIAIVDAETPGTEGIKTSLKSVILEDNTHIRDAIRKIAGKDDIGDQIYYCICRNWKSNLALDPTLTKQAIQIARQSVAPIKKEYQVSQRIVQTQVDGDKLIGMHLTEEMVKLLSIENEKWLATRSWEEKLAYGAAVSLLLLLALAPIWIYIVMVEPRIIQEISRQIFVLAFCFLTLIVAVWAALIPSLPRGAMLFPLALFSQIVTVQYNRRLGILFCGMLLLCLSIALQMTLLEMLCNAGILLTAILPLDRLRGRMQFVRVAIWATITAFLFFSAADLMMGVPVNLKVFSEALVNSLPLLLAGLVVQSLLPLLERYFGILSDVRLLELCDVSNPLLNELITRAPSTYSHSIALGTIGENAADAIHANGLLVRAAAYYHDIGKIYKPNYYAENLIVKEESPHNMLEPTMSALIIIAHVKNGVDLARLYKLPTQIVDLIEQHHGSTLVAYFYNLAKNRRALDPSIPDVEESSFRYPCPKPQTKEAVVLMLADACESACRALVEPTPARIQLLVRKISQERLEDEQFDESGITLTELRTIEDRIVKGLISYHHGRIKYPERIKEVKK